MKSMFKIFVIAVFVMVQPKISYGGKTKVTIAGSSTIRPIVEKAVKAFKRKHPDAEFVIGGGGSSHGVKSAAGGNVLIGMASRNLKGKEKNKWKDLVAYKIGLDGVAVIVNPILTTAFRESSLFQLLSKAV